jgi:hypothetical protein
LEASVPSVTTLYQAEEPNLQDCCPLVKHAACHPSTLDIALPKMIIFITIIIEIRE